MRTRQGANKSRYPASGAYAAQVPLQPQYPADPHLLSKPTPFGQPASRKITEEVPSAFSSSSSHPLSFAPPDMLSSSSNSASTSDGEATAILDLDVAKTLLAISPKLGPAPEPQEGAVCTNDDGGAAAEAGAGMGVVGGGAEGMGVTGLAGGGLGGGGGKEVMPELSLGDAR